MMKFAGYTLYGLEWFSLVAEASCLAVQELHYCEGGMDERKGTKHKESDFTGRSLLVSFPIFSYRVPSLLNSKSQAARIDDETGPRFP